jgi:hypothetical protein
MKVLTIVVLLLAVGFGAYWYGHRGSTTSPIAEVPAPKQGAAQAVPAQAQTQPQQSQAQPPPPPPAPGTLLYQANWSQGPAGWTMIKGWHASGGMILNDGSDSDGTIGPPFQPTGPDYAVEAEMQVVSPAKNDCDSGLGVIVRNGYGAKVRPPFRELCNPGAGTRYVSFIVKSEDFGQPQQFDPGLAWHTYRVEVRGNQLSLLIDGALMLQTTDNRYLAPGLAGIWSRNCQVSVRQFRIIAL